MALTTTARGAGNILSNRIVIDMADSIALLKPRVSPLTAIVKKLNTKPCNSYKFEWMEDSMLGRWTAINNASTAYDANTTEIVVDDGSIIAVNDIIKSVKTGETMKVTAVSTNTLTVVRSYGAVAAHADAVKNDEKLLIVGNAMMQGSGAAAEKYNAPTAAFNYTQIFKTPFSVTSTLEAMKLYGGKELARLQTKKGVEHAMSIEYALLFGEKSLVTTGEQPVSTTGGILEFIGANDSVTELSKATATKADLNSWFEKVFTYGSESRVWFCSPGVISFVNNLAEAKLEIVQGDNDSTFGLEITRVRTPHGTMNMVHHPLLVNGYADYSFALDIENLAYRPLTGRDTRLMTNIQDNDEDGRRDMYITEAGLELKLPSTHSILKLKA